MKKHIILTALLLATLSAQTSNSEFTLTYMTTIFQHACSGTLFIPISVYYIVGKAFAMTSNRYGA